MSESKTGPQSPKRIEVRRSGPYETAHGRLGRARRRALDEAESEIAEDPHHNHWRRATADGAVLEFFAARAGLIVKFRVVSPTMVDLEAVIDLARVSRSGD
jgi:hypothetical protein